jgi:hypothetical protein
VPYERRRWIDHHRNARADASRGSVWRCPGWRADARQGLTSETELARASATEFARSRRSIDDDARVQRKEKPDEFAQPTGSLNGLNGDRKVTELVLATSMPTARACKPDCNGRTFGYGSRPRRPFERDCREWSATRACCVSHRDPGFGQLTQERADRVMVARRLLIPTHERS